MIELADLTETLELLPAEERLIEGRSGVCWRKDIPQGYVGWRKGYVSGVCGVWSGEELIEWGIWNGEGLIEWGILGGKTYC